MKKSLRVISLILSVVLVMSTLTVMGYARADYKGNNSTLLNPNNANGLKFDDVDTAVYSTEQYATMALDRLDQLLAELNLNLEIPIIGNLNLTSIDSTIANVKSLWQGVSGLLNSLGDASLLDLSAIQNTARANGSDLQVVYDLLDLIGGLAPIASLYVSGQIDLGLLNGLISDYVFNIRELVFGLLCQLTGLAEGQQLTNNKGVGTEDYEYFDVKAIPVRYTQYDGTRSPTIVFLQDLLNNLVLGNWEKLNDRFYGITTADIGYGVNNKGSWVVYDEYMFRDGSASGAIIDKTTNPLDLEHYDYYGWVHPDRWVTFGLGDAIRVAKNSAAPAPSYSKVDVSRFTGGNNGLNVYNMVEELLLQAYNGIAVPVLNRIVARWLNEKCGYTFDSKYTEEWMRDANNNIVTDEQGNNVPNPYYDYMYMGEAPEEGANSNEAIFKIFNAGNIHVPYATVEYPYTLFVDAFNHNAVNFVDKIIKYTSKSTSGDVTTYTWKDFNSAGVEIASYNLELIDGDKSNLSQNVQNLVKFILKVTGNEFFSNSLVNRGEVYDIDEIDHLEYQSLIAYIIRSVINASVDWMYIPDNAETETIVGAGLEACAQLAYQDIPQFTYTLPKTTDFSTLEAYNVAAIKEALRILMDVAVYNINANLDAEYATAPGASTTNNGTTNNTGLLAYLGSNSSVDYTKTIRALAAWGVTFWASTKLPGASSYSCLLNRDFNSDNYGGAYTNLTENMVWEDLDTLLNSIIPIKGNTAWLATEINSQTYVVKSLLFDYIIYPLVNNQWPTLLKLLSRNENNNAEFKAYGIERVIINLLKRIFDVLFPNVFAADKFAIDDIINNTLLSNMVSDLLTTLSATLSVQTSKTNKVPISGRGKIIAGVALPIVCKILGLDSRQEFGELENYIPSVIFPDGNNNYKFQVFNGSTGVNTSYMNTSGRVIDHLYTYKILTAKFKDVTASGEGTNLTGLSQNDQIAGDPADVTIPNITAGKLLRVRITYNVLDESGSPLQAKNENNQLADQVLTSDKYCYVVADEDAAKSDSDAIATANIGGFIVKYAPDIYLDSGTGLSGINDYSIEVKNDSGSGGLSIGNLNASSPWIAKSTDAKDISVATTEQGASYYLYPFDADTTNYTRTAWEYQKDEDDAYVLDQWGQRIKTTEIIEDGKTNIADNVYTVSVPVVIEGGSSASIQVRVHLYDSYGLGSLVNNVLKKNYSYNSVRTTGTDAVDTLEAELIKAIQFLYPPRRNGATFEADSVEDGTSKFLTLYRALYSAEQGLDNYLLPASAQELWNAIEGTASAPGMKHNYSRESFVRNGVTLYYRDYLEYDETGYQYFGQRNYVAHSYKVYKNAVSYANGLLDKEWKYVNYTPEEFDELSAEEQADVIEAFQNQEPDIITPIEFSYATHMLTLTYNRLRPYTENSNSKLLLAISTYGSETGDFTSESAANYARAVAFANASKTSNNAERYNKAMSNLIEAWKGLEPGANYDDLDAAVEAALEIFSDLGIADMAGDLDPDALATQDTYTAASMDALVAAYEAGRTALDELSYSLAEQDKVDELADAITTAINNLEDYNPGSGGDDEDEFSFGANDEYYAEGWHGEEYAPYIDEDYASQAELEEVYIEDLGDVVPVSGVVFGLPSGAETEAVNSMFTVTDGYFVILPYSIDPDNISEDYASSGSVLLVFDNNDEFQGAYILALRGDIDSNGAFDDLDIEWARFAFDSDGEDGYGIKYSECDEHRLIAAADMNADGAFDDLDIEYLLFYFDGATLDQVTGEIFIEE